MTISEPRVRDPRVLNKQNHQLSCKATSWSAIHIVTRLKFSRNNQKVAVPSTYPELTSRCSYGACNGLNLSWKIIVRRHAEHVLWSLDGNVRFTSHSYYVGDDITVFHLLHCVHQRSPIRWLPSTGEQNGDLWLNIMVVENP